MQAPDDILQFDPPSVFSKNIFIQEGDRMVTLGPQGYTTRLDGFMVSDYASQKQILYIMKKYNLNFTWQRKLAIVVHESSNIGTGGAHDARCKVEVDGQIGRTKIISSPSRSPGSFIWDDTLNFKVIEPCNINLLVYCKNAIFPNEKLGRIVIPPDKLVERSVVTDWFPLNTKGQIKMSITLSSPTIAPFKFFYNNINKIDDFKNEKAFTISGEWTDTVSIIDWQKNSVINISRIPPQGRSRGYKLYWHGQATSSLSVCWDHHRPLGNTFLVFHLEGDGLPGVTSEILCDGDSYKCFKRSICVASGVKLKNSFCIEAIPGQDGLLLLAVFIVIGRFSELYAQYATASRLPEDIV